jgi:hypothetical protein
MFFPKKTKKCSFGDYRVVRKFAVFPISVVDTNRDEAGIVWLGYYDCVEKCYTSLQWVFQYDVVLGAGRKLAQELAILWDGRLIE